MSVFNADRQIDYAVDANTQDMETARDAQHHGLLANAEATLAVAEELRALREALCGNGTPERRGVLAAIVDRLTTGEGR